MHELPLVKEILDIALRHAEANGVSRIVSINLKIGALCDAEDQWLQRYFSLASRGTKAADASLILSRESAKAKCGACGKEFALTGDSTEKVCCPLCGRRECSLVAGTDYFIESMEAI
jgi:hydrogenase nickel incorporation protein HypA/HybF